MVRLRVATAADAPAIASLYRSLSPHSALMRFSCRPPDESLDKLAAVGPDVYALVGEEGGRVVAEGRWCGQGVPELALTVADDYQRLGLGPVLLEKLRAAARERGIPAFTVLVRADNPQMIRLLQHVGCSVVEPVRDAEASFEIATDELMPAWPAPDGRLRVLVESQTMFDDDATRSARAAGADVRRCLVGRSRLRECPLLVRGRCRLAEGADVVACLVPETEPEVASTLAGAHRDAGRRVLTSLPEWRRAVQEEHVAG